MGICVSSLFLSCSRRPTERRHQDPNTKKSAAPVTLPPAARAGKVSDLADPATDHPASLQRGSAAGSLISSASEKVRTAALKYGKPQASEMSAPLALTASDGTGLKLVSLVARAVINGPLAFTELHLTFQNPRPRVIEGRFSITLPDAAAISRLAMKLPAGWQEAEVVERQAARRMYEDFLHRRQDPALLEKKAGNAFRARIFPIPANGLEEIKVSYSQELISSTAPYRLLLKGLPTIDKLSITAIVGSQGRRPGGSTLGGTLSTQRVVKVARQRFTPHQDFEVPAQTAVAGLRHKNLVVARVRPEVTTTPVPIPSLLVLVDTSASRAAGFPAQVEILTALLRAVAKNQGEQLSLKVACYDQAVDVVFEGRIGQFTRVHQQRILARRPLGASNLSGALRWAARAGQYKRVLLISDGVATAGRTGRSELRQAVKQLRPGVERLDVLMVGGIRDEPLLRSLVSDTLRRDGVVLDGARGSSASIARRLSQVTVSGIEVHLPGARWVWPPVLNGVQPGREVLVYADLPPGASGAGGPLTIRLLGGKRQVHQVRPVQVKRPLLQRAWVKARMARLRHQIDTAAAGKQKQLRKLREQIVELSTTHRVLSDFTALLVLETEQDYRRFGLSRRALADILVVGPGGLEVQNRKSRAAGEPLARPRPALPKTDRAARRTAQGAARASGVLGLLKSRSGSQIASIFGRDSRQGSEADGSLGGLIGIPPGAHGVGGLGIKGVGRGAGGTGEGTIGLGSLGTIGRGGGGGSGAGHGRGVGRLSVRNSMIPRVVLGRAEVQGGLSKEIIRRLIRRHLNELKYCYQRQLRRDPSLYGRLVLTFTISPTGQVPVASVKSSTINNRQVETCAVKAVRRWLFPKPTGGGVVKVTYPFVFRAAGRPTARSGAARAPARPPIPKRDPMAAYSGKMRSVMSQLQHKQTEQALLSALSWRTKNPGDVMALVALGRALHARGQLAVAARAFGSIIDLYPSRADMRRFAGQQLEWLGRAGLDLAVDSYAEAVRQRPDHPNSHRMLAYALLRLGDPEAAFKALLKGFSREYPGGRFRRVKKIMAEDLGLLAAAWLQQQPKQRGRTLKLLEKHNITPADKPSLRFILSWETDANDVDFHIYDGKRDHAFFRNKSLSSGGRLYADVTTGYGPECFTISGKPSAFPYRLQAHYYSRGPMGYGMGRLQVVQHDGEGRLSFRQHPFVVMVDSAYVELGVVHKQL